MTDYPNREHQTLERSARRRAAHLLGQMEAQAKVLRAKVASDHSYVDAADAGWAQEMAGKLREQLTIIETLREVREWHKADVADALAAEELEAQ